MGFLKKFPMSRKRFIGLIALMGAYTMIESNFRPNKSGSNGNPGLADDRPFGRILIFSGGEGKRDLGLFHERTRIDKNEIRTRS